MSFRYLCPRPHFPFSLILKLSLRNNTHISTLGRSFGLKFLDFVNLKQSSSFSFENIFRANARFSLLMSEYRDIDTSADNESFGRNSQSNSFAEIFVRHGIERGNSERNPSKGRRDGQGRVGQGREHTNRGEMVWKKKMVDVESNTYQEQTLLSRKTTLVEIDALGRTLTSILRHRAPDYHLQIRNDGFVEVNSILNLNLKTRAGKFLPSHTIEDVKEAVRLDNKNRFSMSEENGTIWIRANQGHTIKTVEAEHLLKQIQNPSEIPICVHGTYLKFLPSILKLGLSKMKRNEIHFSIGLPKQNHVISGMRSNCEVLIFVDVDKAMNDGIKFYKSENNVILSRGMEGIISSNYFSKILKFPSLEPLQFEKEKIMHNDASGSNVA